MICSNVSIAFTRMNGVDVFVVDRKGRGLLKPQSPLLSEACGVVMERLTGCGSVAVSELKIAVAESSPDDRGSWGGIANTLEARRRAPPGDTLRAAIARRRSIGRRL